MNCENRIALFQKSIKKWYRKHGREFPWRENNATCFERVVSEILLQRTRAETVSNYYADFISRFPSWESIASATRVQIEEFLKPIGLWRQRSLALYNLSRELEKRKFILPSTQKELENLPGIGQYVANAVLMFCHGQKKPLLDGSMARLLERFFGKRKLSDIRYDPYLQDLAQQIVETRNPERMSWGILDFASLICKKKPVCDECPLVEKCFYRNDYEKWKNV